MPSERRVWKTLLPFVGHGLVRWAKVESTRRSIWWDGQEWHLFYPTLEQQRNGTGTQYNPSRQLLLPGIPEDYVEWESMRFKDMPLGTRFQCWGEVYSNYTSAHWITLEKTDKNTATEVDENGRLGQHNAMPDDADFPTKDILSPVWHP